MSDVGSHREGRWLGKTTCKKVPVEFCGNGCIITEGREICKDEKLYTLGNIHISVMRVGSDTFGDPIFQKGLQN